jgi:hypothetical protein
MLILPPPTVAAEGKTVASTPSKARAASGEFISWVEHIVDAEDVNGGASIRGGDGLVMADLNRDGFIDIVSAHEDSNHLRIAFGSADPNLWRLRTIAEATTVAAIEDVAVGDLNGDGWLDIMAACEEAHLAYFQNPGAGALDSAWPFLIPEQTKGRGSWLRVFMADINGDGRIDVTAANKGAADLIRTKSGNPTNRPTSLFLIKRGPARPIIVD